MTSRRKLADIVRESIRREKVAASWRDTEAAEELSPIPPGEYLFVVVEGEFCESRSNGTLGYSITLEVAEGDYEGRRCWHTFWLTEAAMRISKRDLEKIGVTELEDLDNPLPAGIRIRGNLVIRKSDDGNEFNKLTRFESAGVEPGDAFASENTPEGSTEFDFGANESDKAGPYNGKGDRP